MSLPDGVPRRPQRPYDEMCCKRGCEPCIFDYYERALNRWEAKVRALGHDPEQLAAAGSGVTPKV